MLLQAKGIYHEYENQQVLKNINCSFSNGNLYAIIGKSGSGKTTLLSLLSGLDSLQKGELLFEENSIKDLTKYRRGNSIIFQSYNLVNYLTPIENIIISLDIDRIEGNKREIAEKWLKQVGIVGELQNKKCELLSGGQQQRVAIARTLASDTRIIFADEPTGNLDSVTAKEVITIFKKLTNEYNKCLICVTHDHILEKYADKVFHISDGVLQEKL